MNPSDVLVAVPTRGTIDYQTVSALQALRDRTPGLSPVLYVQGKMGAAETRNRIVQQFLALDRRVLLMVDDDVYPPLRLMDMVAKVDSGEWDVLGCPVLMIRDGVPLFAVMDDEARWVTRGEGVTEVGVIGTGCIAVSHRVLRELPAPAFRDEWDEHGCLRATEDVAFSRRAAGYGFRVGCDWTVGIADHRVEVGVGQLVRKRGAA